ncbi:hypothetical protein BAE44_0013789 [Dichanthelium oligosanthes]|uniref:Bowman-Birk serine protease inhibitors family domain-containing protein n=1 Tax=Dichanthelium oligosanthes TaxID=888268 RepID=A0A1E5VJD4_9POAL|nr:hypothetical protein BAE44_0013789 [Dichanthelium oligosanthes]
MAVPRRATAMLWLAAAVAVVAAVAGAAAAESGAKLGCFCDCMKNRCMTLGADADKYDCAAACTEGCTQIGKPGQPRADDFCGL